MSFTKTLCVLFTLSAFLSTEAGENKTMNTNAKRIVRTYTQHLKASPSKVFPLLCPVKEYEWIEHWKCDVVYTESGYAENNCIFKTDFNNDGPEKIWVVTTYIPNEKIEFIVTNPNQVIRFGITLKADNNGGTIAEWKQIITALNENGEKYIAELTEEKYTEEKKNLEEILNYYLTTNKMYKQ